MSNVLYILSSVLKNNVYTPWKGWHDVTGSKDNILFLPTEEHNFFQPFSLHYNPVCHEKIFGY